MQLFEGSSSLNKGHPTNKSGNRDINAKISSNIYLITARMTCQWNSSADWVSMNVNVSTASWIKKSSYKTCQKRLLINILQLVKFHRQSSIWECQFRLTRSWQDHWMAGVCKANLGLGLFTLNILQWLQQLGDAADLDKPMVIIFGHSAILGRAGQAQFQIWDFCLFI